MVSDTIDGRTGVATDDGGVDQRVGTLALFLALARKRLRFLRRSLPSTVARFVGMYGFFAVIFVGGRVVAPEQLQDALGFLVVGYFLYTLASVAFAQLAFGISQEAKWGTLEQLYLTPFGFGRVMALQVAVYVLESFVWGLGMLALLVPTTGLAVSVPPLAVITVGGFALLSAVGVGFVVGAVALWNKEIEDGMQILFLGLLALTATPVESYPALKALPLSQGSYLLRRVMVDGHSLWSLPGTEVGILAVVGVGWLVAGYAVFRWTTERVRQAGTMGHY